MTKRLATAPVPEPLEEYVRHFDELFDRLNQREGLRQYLEGLLLPTERNKTLTALTNTEPIVGAQNPKAQSLQWFLSESNWDERAVQARRLKLLTEDELTEPEGGGVLVIDEHGDRKQGKHTDHVGRQWLGNIGKTENGVVSVSSLWADEQVYYPVDFEPYTPQHHFERGRSDPDFRTKLKIGLELVEGAVRAEIPFRAVVADAFYGEDEDFKHGLRELGLGYVLSLKPSHSWWHPEGEIGALWQVAEMAGWKDTKHPGKWVKVERTFRDSHKEDWWALPAEAGPYGSEKNHRAFIVSTDPKELPEISTWYLVTNLPAPASERSKKSELTPASLEEVVRLYGLRMWVEQSYKQVKHALGWSQYQVRHDRAMRRHWQLVCCAFSFCWWHQGNSPGNDDSSQPQATEITEPAIDAVVGRGENKLRRGEGSTEGVVASSVETGQSVAGAVCNAVAILESVVQSTPTSTVAKAA